MLINIGQCSRSWGANEAEGLGLEGKLDATVAKLQLPSQCQSHGRKTPCQHSVCVCVRDRVCVIVCVERLFSRCHKPTEIEETRSEEHTSELQSR